LRKKKINQQDDQDSEVVGETAVVSIEESGIVPAGGRGIVASEGEESICIVFGAHAHGPAEVDWTEKVIAVSKYPLSAAAALARACHAFEMQWGIL